MMMSQWRRANISMQRRALRAAADAGRWADAVVRIWVLKGATG